MSLIICACQVDKKIFYVQFKLYCGTKIFLYVGNWRGITQGNNIFNPWLLP